MKRKPCYHCQILKKKLYGYRLLKREAELAELDVNSERAKELQDAIDNLKTQLDNLNIGTFDEKTKPLPNLLMPSKICKV